MYMYRMCWVGGPAIFKWLYTLYMYINPIYKYTCICMRVITCVTSFLYRIINLDSPLYLFSSLGRTTNQMLSQTPFSGCLGDVRIGGKAEGKLVDFSDVVTHSGATLIPGCSPSLSTCGLSTSCEGNEECVHFWNGSRCHGNANSNPISFEGVASSYEASPIATAASSTLESISFELRTVQDGYRLLLTVGEEASLEVC